MMYTMLYMDAHTPPLTAAQQENGLVLLTLSGDLAHEKVEELNTCIEMVKKTIADTSKKTGKRVKVLLDMTQFSGIYAPAAIEKLAGLARDDQQYVEKTACFGTTTVTRLAGDMVALFANRENIHFFAKREDAQIWLDS